MRCKESESALSNVLRARKLNDAERRQEDKESMARKKCASERIDE